LPVNQTNIIFVGMLP